MLEDPSKPMPILNVFGFKEKCCRIIPLKIGTIVTCFTSILWAAAELISTEKYIARILPNKGIAFSILCSLYMVLMIGFAVASGIFLVGILAVFIYFYTWAHFWDVLLELKHIILPKKVASDFRLGLVTNFAAITGYLWYAVVFDFVYVAVYIATIVGCFVNDNLNRKVVVRWVCAFVWQFVFWYLLVIVHSYRISIWSVNFFS